MLMMDSIDLEEIGWRDKRVRNKTLSQKRRNTKLGAMSELFIGRNTHDSSKTNNKQKANKHKELAPTI
jgi:hypothetical protein